MRLSEVNTEIRALFEAYWGTTTPIYYENISFNTFKANNSATAINSFIRLTIEQIKNENIGIGTTSSKRLKRSSCFLFIDYFFQANTSVITVNETVENIIDAMQNKTLTQGRTYEGSRTGVYRATNKAYNMIRITMDLDYEYIQ